MRTRLVRLMVSVIVLVCIAACGASIDDAHYGKIKTGMTEAEVEGVLGKATDGGGASVLGMQQSSKTWKSGDRSIVVTFVNGKVITVAKQGF